MEIAELSRVSISLGVSCIPSSRKHSCSFIVFTALVSLNMYFRCTSIQSLLSCDPPAELCQVRIIPSQNVPAFELEVSWRFLTMVHANFTSQNLPILRSLP